MKRLLELYRNAIGYRNSITGGANAILQAEGKEEVRQWYLNLEKLTREEIRAKSIDSMIFHVCRTDWILRVIKVVMDRVEMFPEFGELYYNILQIAYFEKDKMSDQKIVEKLTWRGRHITAGRRKRFFCAEYCFGMRQSIGSLRRNKRGEVVELCVTR